MRRCNLSFHHMNIPGSRIFRELGAWDRQDMDGVNTPDLLHSRKRVSSTCGLENAGVERLSDKAIPRSKDKAYEFRPVVPHQPTVGAGTGDLPVAVEAIRGVPKSASGNSAGVARSGPEWVVRPGAVWGVWSNGKDREDNFTDPDLDYGWISGKKSGTSSPNASKTTGETEDSGRALRSAVDSVDVNTGIVLRDCKVKQLVKCCL